MPPAAIAYKQTHASQAEPIGMDEPLWQHIRTATSVVERLHAGRPQTGDASAVVVRPAGGEPIVVVFVDRQTGALPGPEDLCRRFNLTRREAEVALLLAERMSCREIAERLFIGFYTARSHTEKVMEKLGVRSKHAVRARISR